MIRTLAVAATIALVAGAASAQKLDKNGRCHDAAGKFAKADVCKNVAALGPDAGPYKLDAKGHCHDAKGRMAKKDLCRK